MVSVPRETLVSMFISSSQTYSQNIFQQAKFVFCNLIFGFLVIKNQEYPERLMLTYKPEEESLPPEESEVPADEPKPVPSDDATVSTAEVSAPPPPPSNNFATDDLLVKLSLLVFIVYLLILFGT